MPVTRSRRLAALAAASALGAAGLVLSTTAAADAATNTFDNPGTITIGDNAAATPYPSDMQVTGVAGSITDVSVTLFNVTHSFLADVGIVLVAPNGNALTLMDDSGDGAVSGIDLVISDTGTTPLPAFSTPGSGTYKPSSYNTDRLFPPLGTLIANPGPAGNGTATFASTFKGDDANGTWSLYVRDFQSGDIGEITGGWSLTIASSDTTATPTVTATNPATSAASPSSVNQPQVRGTAQVGSTVTLYNNATCSGQGIGSGTAAEFAFPGIDTPVFLNATTTIYAKATKATLADSACSAAPFSYTNDSTAPAAPTGLSVSPASPAPSLTLSVKGSAETNSTVNLYANAACTGAPVATGKAATFSTSGLAASVVAGSTTSFAATATDAAGNTSSCSAAVPYTQDSTAPAAPTGLSVSPASPGSSLTPSVKGSAEAGATVTLYRNAGCTGPPAASGSAAEFSTPGLTAPVVVGSTTSFAATATDAAGNISPCSAPVTYTQDSTPLAAPTGLSVSPASPGSSLTPSVKGSAVAGTTVKLYPNAGCTGTPAASGAAASFGSPGLTAPVAAGSTTSFAATATDAVGNTSACSAAVTYVQTPAPPAATAPDTTITKKPAKRVKTVHKRKKVRFAYVSSMAGATFQCSIDGKAFKACGSRLAFKAKVGKHTVAVRAVLGGVVDPTPATYRFKVKRT